MDNLAEEINNLEYIPPEESWAVRKAEIYKKFQDFAKVCRSNIKDESFLKSLTEMEKKFL